MSEFKKNLREDWTIFPFLGFTLLGFATAILDFIYLQNFNFQVYGIVRFFLLIFGGIIASELKVDGFFAP